MIVLLALNGISVNIQIGQASESNASGYKIKLSVHEPV